ncbi:hypothetical protein OUZ56_032261 [Daphnia magna]|uniref:Uncharacterized protein n=1 Tax=Daphnia magna TaxID=35525 RepID=A0ABQ9ZWM3_9CRUS|nr:hypothetical protein OUZ56_032261 [Daphnia magna]
MQPMKEEKYCHISSAQLERASNACGIERQNGQAFRLSSPSAAKEQEPIKFELTALECAQ